MKDNYSIESAKNFEMLGAEITLDFLFDNLRPVAKRSIVRNLVVTAINEIYGTSVVRICDAIGYHRNSYYGVRMKLENRLNQTESEVTRKIISSYSLQDKMQTPVCAADPDSIYSAVKEMLDHLNIDAEIKAQIAK